MSLGIYQWVPQPMSRSSASSREVLAGIAIGLTLIKPQYVPAFLILLLIGRCWRALAAFLVTACGPIVGAVIGFLVGLTSVGSGTLIIVSLLFLYPRGETKDLVGTDVFHAAMLVSAASLAQLAAGNVNVPMMLSLLLGSVPGVLLGSRLALGFPEQFLRLSLASVMLVSGSKLL